MRLQDPERSRGQPSPATDEEPGARPGSLCEPTASQAVGWWRLAGCARSGKGCLQTAADSFPAEASLVKQKK